MWHGQSYACMAMSIDSIRMRFYTHSELNGATVSACHRLCRCGETRYGRNIYIYIYIYRTILYMLTVARHNGWRNADTRLVPWHSSMLKFWLTVKLRQVFVSHPKRECVLSAMWWWWWWKSTVFRNVICHVIWRMFVNVASKIWQNNVSRANERQTNSDSLSYHIHIILCVNRQKEQKNRGINCQLAHECM